MNSSSLIERYEMKYRIPVAMMAPLEAAVLAYCDPDAANKDGDYLITSLYLDTPDWRLARDTLERNPRRYKLRVRRYTNGTVFVEIKRRIKDVVAKSRAKLPKGAWPAVATDPRVACELDLKPKTKRDLDDFFNRQLILGAGPATLVRYRRKAFVSRVETYARVTFDYKIEAARPNGWQIPLDDAAGWRPVDRGARFGLGRSGVVLELKCLPAVPHWMTDLVHRFDLRRSGFSKYVYCSQELNGGVGRWEPKAFIPSRRLGGRP